MANDNFKIIPQSKWSGLYESQVCVVVLKSDKQVFAGYFEDPEGETRTFDLQGCHKYNNKKWVRASGSRLGMSYCDLDIDMIQNVFVPKKDIELDACMALWS